MTYQGIALINMVYHCGSIHDSLHLLAVTENVHEFVYFDLEMLIPYIKCILDDDDIL